MDRPSRSRTRRFTLPEHDDARVHRVVEGLLSDSRPTAHPERGRPRDQVGDPLAALVPRMDWAVELASEERRRARYNRPVSIAVVEVRAARDPERLMRLAAGILRRESREADRVTRVGPRRFHVLLPETRERGATHYAERVRAAWQTVFRDVGGADAVPLQMTVAGTRHAETVPDTLERAIRQLA